MIIKKLKLKQRRGGQFVDKLCVKIIFADKFLST